MASLTRLAVRIRWRRVLGWAITALACALVAFALVAPNDRNRFDFWAFVRVPLEGLVLAALVLVLPATARRWVAGVAGALLGVLLALKLFDIGFFAVLYRPFDPVLDWAFVAAGVDYLTATNGKFLAIAAVIGAVVAVLAMLVGMTLAALRLSRIVGEHRTWSIRTVAVLTVVWAVCGMFGAPLAAHSASEYAYLHAKQIPAGIADQQAFAREAGIDAFRATPGGDLLTSLHGKDVVLTFVESYGRSAIEHPELAPAIGALLDDGTRRLKAAGFEARSGFLASPTFGGGSWLAHATLDSGLWIDNQQRYRNLVTTDRMTLNKAFQRAGWRTVGVEPAVTQAWPEGKFYGYDRIYEFGDLGYRGPRFSYALMPDQYILSAFHHSELAAPNRATPVMAQITTLSSHAPWEPVPRLLDWHEVGDGSVYNGMAADNAPPEAIFSRVSSQVRADYGKAILYALNNLISYVEHFGDENLVLVFLGDHQPAPVVTGENASHDVPITIVAHDPEVLRRVSSWGWQSGLKPGPDAPVLRMNEFRDRFLSAFGPAPAH